MNHAGLYDTLATVIEEALRKGLATACSVGFRRLSEAGVWGGQLHCGRVGGHRDSPPVTKDTLYDLASLTKPVVTLPSVLSMVQREQLPLSAPISRFLPNVPEDKRAITLLDLLSHRSGLPGHVEFANELLLHPPATRKVLLKELILDHNLLYTPGSDCVYSDIGYLLLGLLVEKVTGRSLAVYWREYAARGLIEDSAIAQFSAHPSISAKRDLCVETGNCSWSGQTLKGIVHDDNCRAIGRLAGHAGLFGSLDAMLACGVSFLRMAVGEEMATSFSPSLFKSLLAAIPGSTWVAGFDRPTPGISTSGRFFSCSSRGHLGYTGTSLWFDPERAVVVVVLTNRVLGQAGREDINLLRATIHDIIMEKMCGE